MVTLISVAANYGTIQEKDHLVQGKGQKHAVPDVQSVRRSSTQTHAKQKRVPNKEPHSPEKKVNYS